MKILQLLCSRCYRPSNIPQLSSLNRAEQSSSLLPATSQHGHSWHRAPLGPMVIVRTAWNTQTHCVGWMQSFGMLKRVVHIVQCFGYLTTSDHQLYRVWVLERPFRLLIGFITISNHLVHSYTFVTTITHNYLLRCVTFTQLTILHANIPLYSLAVSIAHFPCLSPTENSLVGLTSKNSSRELLLNNWLLTTPVPLI
jgi:hypothetical protein